MTTVTTHSLTAIFQDNSASVSWDTMALWKSVLLLLLLLTRVSRHQNVSILYFIGAKDDRSGSDNWSYKTCSRALRELNSRHQLWFLTISPFKTSPPTNQHPTCLQARCPFYRPSNSVRALKVKVSHPTDLLTPTKLTWGLSSLSWAPGYLE